MRTPVLSFPALDDFEKMSRLCREAGRSCGTTSLVGGKVEFGFISEVMK